MKNCFITLALLSVLVISGCGQVKDNSDNSSNALQDDCVCPDNYVKEGDSCNPKCYYSTPKCLMPSIQCSKKDAQIANPASVYCIEQGGQTETITDSDGSQSENCILKDGTVCDSWAYFRKECPK